MAVFLSTKFAFEAYVTEAFAVDAFSVMVAVILAGFHLALGAAPAWFTVANSLDANASFGAVIFTFSCCAVDTLNF